MNQDSITPTNSIPVLLRELRDETTTLLRQEVALAKTELKDNFSHLTNHAMHVAIGAFVAYAGIIVLLIGIGQLLGALLIRAGVDERVANWASTAVVGLVVAVIGWAMLAKAKHAMAHEDIKPHQTIETMRENKQWVQSKLHHSP
jgi:hypothetical protein